MHYSQQSSGKFRLHERLLHAKLSLKMLPPHFRYFHCFIFKMNFDKNLMKKLPFLTSFKFRLFRKISCFSNRQQLNDYRKYSLNNSQNLQAYFAFAVSRRCANCCFKISNPSQPFTKKGSLKKFIHHFQYFHYSNIDMTYITNFMKILLF